MLLLMLLQPNSAKTAAASITHKNNQKKPKPAPDHQTAPEKATN
jgi:hypothetical protein